MMFKQDVLDIDDLHEEQLLVQIASGARLLLVKVASSKPFSKHPESNNRGYFES